MEGTPEVAELVTRIDRLEAVVAKHVEIIGLVWESLGKDIEFHKAVQEWAGYVNRALIPMMEGFPEIPFEPGEPPVVIPFPEITDPRD